MFMGFVYKIKLVASRLKKPPLLYEPEEKQGPRGVGAVNTYQFHLSHDHDHFLVLG